MLIRFDVDGEVEPKGKITHIRSDPESQEVIDNFVAEGDWLHLPVIPLPAVVVRDDDGKLVIENGKVKRESPGYTHPVVTHDFHYVKDGVVLDRPTLPAGEVEIKADGIDAYVLEGLPVPCAVRLDGVLVEIDDGRLEFSTTDAGTYVFESVFPFVDAKIRVTAT